MKRILTSFAIVGASLVVAFGLVRSAHAEKRYTTNGADLGYDNEVDDQYACRWRAPFDAEVQEEDVPGEGTTDSLFYKEGSKEYNACETVKAITTSHASWQKFKDVGEAALWPPFCFNVLNYYFPNYGLALNQWIGLFGSLEWNINYDTWSEAYYFANGITNKRTDPPNINIIFSNAAPKVGETEKVSATVLGSVHSTQQNILIGWSSRRVGGEFISQQGLAAGGKEITDVAGTLGNAVESCRQVTRVPSHDSDKDGMDDDWEIRYGFDPANGSDAFTDPDGDGFNISDLDNFAERNNFLGNCEAGTRACPIHVTPDTTAQSLPGDGAFTNQEEYIWGTNPLDPDSDDDGYPDEADIVGVGQTKLEFVSDLIANTPDKDRITFRATTVVASGMLNEDNSGTYKTKIDSQEKTLFAGTDNSLAVDLTAVIPNPINGDPNINTPEGRDAILLMDASPTQTSSDRAALEYRWTLNFQNKNGQVSDRQELTDKSGIGKYQLQLPVRSLAGEPMAQSIGFTTTPGEVVYVNVEVFNSKTKEVSFDRIPVSIGDLFDFNIEIDRGNGYESLLDVINALPDTDPCKKQMRSQSSIVDVIPFCAWEGIAVRVTVSGANESPDDLVYDWWVNGTKDQEGNSQIYTFTPSGPGSHWTLRVSAHGKDQRREERFAAQLEFVVQGPNLVISPKPSNPVVGQPIDIYAGLLEAPTGQSVSFDWSVEQANVPNPPAITAGSCPSDIAQITDVNFAGAPCSVIHLTSDVPTTYTVTVNAAYNYGDHVNKIVTQKQVITVQSAPVSQSVFGKAKQGMASIGTQVRSIFAKVDHFLELQ